MSFRFKQFAVDDSRSAMKVGTDSVVLGSWLQADNPLTVLDIGAGCGLLALMMAQRFPNAKILAVEIDPEAAADARANAVASPWADRIEILNADIFQAALGRFDLIVSNPPFFTEALHAPDRNRAAARHESALGIDSLIAFAAEHLTEAGSLAFVAPAQRDSEIEFALTMRKLRTNRLLRMRQREARPFVRTFRQASFNSGLTESTELTVNTPDGSRTPEYSELTNHFYL